MLLHRILTALVGVPAVLAAIWFGPPWLTLLAAAAAVIGVREAYRLHPPTPMPEPTPTTDARPSSSFRRKPESVVEMDASPSSSFQRKPESVVERDARNADAGDTGNADGASNDDNDAAAPAYRHTRLPLLLGGAWAIALVLAGELAGSAADFARAAAGICIAGVIIASLWMVAAWHGRRPLTAMLYLAAAPVYIGGALACAVALRGIVGAEVELPLPTAGADAMLSDSPQPGIPLLDETLFDDPGTPPPVALTDLASSDLPPADLAPAMDGGEIAEIGELPAQQQAGSAVQLNGGGTSGVWTNGVWLLPAIAGGGFAVAAANLLTAGGWWLLLGILAVYAADTGAYAVGRLIGRHPMAPGISPGKSWEGAAGGMAGAVIAAVVLGLLFPVRLQIWQLAGIGVILGIVSPLGDLLESKIKRRAGVKDSGGLFPGHGGMLDRLDSLLPSLMVVYLLALLLAPQP